MTTFRKCLREPIRQQHQFRRNCRNQAPIERAHHRQIKTHVGIRRFQAAQLVNLAAWRLPCAAPAPNRLPAAAPRKPSRRVQLGRTTVENIPAAVRQLPFADIVRELRNFLGVQLPKNVQVENVIGLKSRVRFEFGPPVALLVLRGQ